MILTIELNAEEERRLRGAEARGIDVASLIREMLAGLPEAPVEPQKDRTLALLAQWAEEDATDDPEELARRDAETEEFMASLRENRLQLREANDR